MENLYAPWRSKYVPQNDNTNKCNSKCVFCEQFDAKQDDKHFILKRYEHCAVMLNLHPYNAGHLLVLPFEHKASLALLDRAARAELMEVISICNEIVVKALACEAINVGLNLGSAGGGSIPDHLHFHIVPRWASDANFLVIISNTKVISYDLREIFVKLKAFF